MGVRGVRTRAVFDCMVFLQAAVRSEGPSGFCLQFVRGGVVELCLSQAIHDEVADVLHRPKVRDKFPVLTDRMAADFLRSIRFDSTLFEEVPHSIRLTRDPKDEPYLNLAVHAMADFLVTRDSHMLDLVTANDPESRWIREACAGVRMLSDRKICHDRARPSPF